LPERNPIGADYAQFYLRIPVVYCAQSRTASYCGGCAAEAGQEEVHPTNTSTLRTSALTESMFVAI
jgi:hypothetical protein